MTVAKPQTRVGTHRRRVSRSQYQKFDAVNDFSFLLSMSAPKQENQILFFGRQLPDSIFCKSFPTSFLVTAGARLSDCQYVVEQQYTLFCPTGKISGIGYRASNALMYFL